MSLFCAARYRQILSRNKVRVFVPQSVVTSYLNPAVDLLVKPTDRAKRRLVPAPVFDDYRPSAELLTACATGFYGL
jgi:hypothetical protein